MKKYSLHCQNTEYTENPFHGGLNENVDLRRHYFDTEGRTHYKAWIRDFKQIRWNRLMGAKRKCRPLGGHYFDKEGRPITKSVYVI